MLDCTLDSSKNGLSVEAASEADLPDTVWTIYCLHTASYQQVKILFNNPENSANRLFFAVFERFSVNTTKSQQVTGKLNQLNIPTECAIHQLKLLIHQPGSWCIHTIV